MEMKLPKINDWRNSDQFQSKVVKQMARRGFETFETVINRISTEATTIYSDVIQRYHT